MCRNRRDVRRTVDLFLKSCELYLNGMKECCRLVLFRGEGTTGDSTLCSGVEFYSKKIVWESLSGYQGTLRDRESNVAHLVQLKLLDVYTRSPETDFSQLFQVQKYNGRISDVTRLKTNERVWLKIGKSKVKVTTKDL